MRQLVVWGLAILVLIGLTRPIRAYTEPPLESYTRQSPNNSYVFVMLHPPREHWVDPIAAKYPASGLYRNDDSWIPLWTFDDGYVREAYPASDGVHLVVQYRRVISVHIRDCGNSPPVPPANPEVLGFYANGKKIRDVKFGEVLDNAAFCRKHGPGYHSWLDSARVDDAESTFVLATTEGTRRVLDLDSGDRSGSVSGLSDPEDRPVGKLLALVLGGSLAVFSIAGIAVIALILYHSRHPSHPVAGST